MPSVSTLLQDDPKQFIERGVTVAGQVPIDRPSGGSHQTSDKNGPISIDIYSVDFDPHLLTGHL
jgi:hypothetical protein